MADQDDIDKSGDPGEEDDGFDPTEHKPPFAPNNETPDIDGDDILKDVDDALSGLENAEVEGDETPTPDMPEAEDSNPAEPGESSFPVIPEIADEGRAPFGADIAGVDLAEEVPGAHKDASFTPDFEDLDSTQSALESFGNDVERFHASGGAEDGIPDINGDDDGGGEKDGAEQVGESSLGMANQMKEMLIEVARRMDEITRSLEAERL